MKTVKFQAGDRILKEGDEGHEAYLIVEGSVEVTVGEGSDARQLGVLESGEVFGEMSLLEPGPRSASVIAVTDTECVVTSYEEFLASIQESPERAVEFMKTLVRRLRQVTELLAGAEPKRRGLRGLLHDWKEALDPADEELTDEELERKCQMMLYWGPMF